MALANERASLVCNQQQTDLATPITQLVATVGIAC